MLSTKTLRQFRLSSIPTSLLQISKTHSAYDFSRGRSSGQETLPAEELLLGANRSCAVLGADESLERNEVFRPGLTWLSPVHLDFFNFAPHVLDGREHVRSMLKRSPSSRA